MPPTYYRGCWHVVSRGFFWRYRHPSRLLTARASSLLKGVYNPKAFFPHAALLRHAFAHCARFPTAASRRSLGRVSVPVWLIVLSDQLPIEALVSRYLTNKLMGRGPIPMRRQKLPFLHSLMRMQHIRYEPGFPRVVPVLGAGYPRVTHPFAALPQGKPWFVAPLACVKHAASVRPEPGSNSP